MPPRLLRGRAGIALLEVLVAVALLGGAGLAVVALLREALQAEAAAAGEERRYAAADRVLAASTLLSARDLDQRLGRRPLGEFVVEVTRPEAGLYRLAVFPPESPASALLVTVVARAPASNLP